MRSFSKGASLWEPLDEEPLKRSLANGASLYMNLFLVIALSLPEAIRSNRSTSESYKHGSIQKRNALQPQKAERKPVQH